MLVTAAKTMPDHGCSRHSISFADINQDQLEADEWGCGGLRYVHDIASASDENIKSSAYKFIIIPILIN